MSTKLILLVASLLSANLVHAKSVGGEGIQCDGDGLSFVPNSVDCSKYYMCWQGEPILKECPPNLLWDQSEITCNYAEYTICAGEQPLPPKFTKPPPATKAPTTQPPRTEAPVTKPPVTEGPVTEAPVTSRPVTSAPVTSPPSGGSVECPRGDIFEYRADPTNCNRFFVCDLGKSSGNHACGQNLHFSYSLQACVRPEKSECTPAA